MTPRRRRSASAFALALVVAGVVSAQPAAPLAVTGNAMTRPAAPSRLAAHSLLLDVAAAGPRLVAVGERGRVLLSDDAGQSWRQAAQVPVSVTLTALCFVDARRGWAVGHAGVVLHTVDAGDHWALQLDGASAAQSVARLAASHPDDAAAKRSAELLVADGPDKPFLAVHFGSATAGVVAGAYGLLFSTDDGGTTWRPRMADAENPKGLHLNAVFGAGRETWVAGERGLLLRGDGSGRFVAVASPYDGSWFAAAASPARGITLAGLRGNLFNSRDGGATWQKIGGAGTQTFGTARQVGDKLLLVSQSGAAYALDPLLRLTALDIRPPPAPITALLPVADGLLVATTLRGPVRLPYGAAPVAAR